MRKNTAIKENAKKHLKFDDAKKVITKTIPKNPKIALYMALGCFTGLRHAETIRITKTQLKNNRVKFHKEKKTSKYTSRKLPQSFFSLIDKIDLSQFDEQLFLNRSKTQLITYPHINERVKFFICYHLNESKEDIATHTLRKTFGRRFYELHENKSEALLKLQIYFNHTSVEETKIYIGITQEEMEDVIELF